MAARGRQVRPSIYIMPTLIVIFALVLFYIFLIGFLEAKNPSSFKPMYPYFVSWGINETKLLLTEAEAKEPSQYFIHGISSEEFLNIRIVNSDYVIVDNETYRYFVLYLELNNAVYWRVNATWGGCRINLTLSGPTGNGTLYSRVFVYRNGRLMGFIQYSFVEQILSYRSPQIYAWNVGGILILSINAWYYGVLNVPNQLYNSTGSNLIYPHGSIYMWLALIPQGLCGS